MPFQHFAKHTRAVVAAAVREEATTDGRGLVEAEHLLLALAASPQLTHLGLDHDQLASALIHEEQQSLAAVGVVADELPRAGSPRGGSPRLAASAKQAIERAAKITAKRGQRQMTAQTLLLGVIGAEHGRVPRTLQLAEIDISKLRARL
jgi:ATP-dependent Clp protease ATP-binding subunit ClpA